MAFMGSFLIGFLYDITVGLLIVIPFTLQITFTNNFVYTKKGKWAGIAFFVVILGIYLFTPLVPRDFNKGLYKYVLYYIILRLLIFLFLYTRGISFRYRWRSVILHLFLFISIFILLFNAVSEWFFWNEFSSRYNFIAVDYLIYTNEVIGNIRESYPLTGIIVTLLIITAGMFYFIRKPVAHSVSLNMPFIKRVSIAFILIVSGLLLSSFLPPRMKYFSKNNYVNELAGNGFYDFVQAFKNNELDFYTYYRTLPDSTVFKTMRQELEAPNSHFMNDTLFDLRRCVHYPGTEKKMNVVLISVESLSASFMKAFGNTQDITPQLDSIARKGMLFTNVYASGTRTVRGLEALSLSVPPLPGQSIIKRPVNEDLFSLGSVFKDKGYITQYMYGGYGYFDNMNYFFGHNGYEVIDRTALKPNEIHYANIWGVADEDLFTLALRMIDKNAATGNPFFTQVMTVSNHRPYTYPDGRINIPPSTQTREGAVKYTDYAIGRFIREASAKPWFANTLFVIVADHCASSAGKQELSLPGYHIPMIIYSPGNIETKEVAALTAQVDIAPTILGLLNFSYTSKFFGQDIFNTPVEKQRVFISTYQGLGYLANGILVIQSPVKKIRAFMGDREITGSLNSPGMDTVINRAVSSYQAMAWLIKNKKYGSVKK